MYPPRIFLLEYLDANIQTAVPRKNECAEIYDSYRISADKFLLKWIYDFKDDIDFLILVNLVPYSLEVIKLDTIPEILKEGQEAIYAPVVGFESHKFHGIKFSDREYRI